MCIIPYATQRGEISLCAYNTGIRWRRIIENMYKNSTVSEWYRWHIKREICARGKSVPFSSTQRSLHVKPLDAARARPKEHDAPTTAAEEEKAGRRAAREAQQARQVYEELMLHKPEAEPVRTGTSQSEVEAEKVTA